MSTNERVVQCEPAQQVRTGALSVLTHSETKRSTIRVGVHPKLNRLPHGAYVDLHVLAQHLLGEPGRNRRYAALWRGGEGFNVSIRGDYFTDWVTGEHGDALKLIELATGSTRVQA